MSIMEGPLNAINDLRKCNMEYEATLEKITAEMDAWSARQDAVDSTLTQVDQEYQLITDEKEMLDLRKSCSDVDDGVQQYFAELQNDIKAITQDYEAMQMDLENTITFSVVGALNPYKQIKSMAEFFEQKTQITSSEIAALRDNHEFINKKLCDIIESFDTAKKEWENLRSIVAELPTEEAGRFIVKDSRKCRQEVALQLMETEQEVCEMNLEEEQASQATPRVDTPNDELSMTC